MRVVVVGATGVIGSAVAGLFAERHTVVRVGHSRGELTVDAGSEGSVREMFDRIGTFDALVSTIGGAVVRPLAKLSDDDLTRTVDDKVRRQVRLVRLGLERISDAGSFTLSSGVLGKEGRRQWSGFSVVSLANGAIDAFVRSAATEMPRGLRINAVSPPFVTETMGQAGVENTFGYPECDAATVAAAYRESVEGDQTGANYFARCASHR